nr:MAG TPA: hypothetical protein [Caudoviricetes sp.]
MFEYLIVLAITTLLKIAYSSKYNYSVIKIRA